MNCNKKKTAVFNDEIKIVETSELYYIRSRYVLFPKIKVYYV